MTIRKPSPTSPRIAATAMTAAASMLAALLVLGVAVDARAQPSFPANEYWLPLPCQGGVMTDPASDQAGAPYDRDLVGDSDAPAGYRSFDAGYLYLRLRLDRDPAPGGTPTSFSWGFEFVRYGGYSSYDLLIIVDGAQRRVALHRNTTVTLPDDPADPADDPPIATYPFATHARTVPAPGSNFGGDADTFLEIAVPWSGLASLNLYPTSLPALWAGSSTTANALDADLACHDGSGGVAPKLTGIASPYFVLVPEGHDWDLDGYTDRAEIAAGTDPLNADQHPTGPPDTPILAGGGPGCSIGNNPSRELLSTAILLAIVFFVRRRGRYLGAGNE